MADAKKLNVITPKKTQWPTPILSIEKKKFMDTDV